jgi:predicted protein tyrosine phosphatase
MRPTNVLFVCSANQQRSPTAEEMYRGDPRYEVRSAGTHTVFGHEVTPDDLNWADLVVTMEDHHKERILAAYPDESETVRFQVLGIPDVFQYMDPTLQREIRSRFEP